MLARQVSLYTLGESSSLPEYEALQLLSSVCMVLGIDAENVDEARVQEVLSAGVQASFDAGLKQLEQQVARTGNLWKEVCLTTPLLESRALKDTLESLRAVGTRYDARFFACEIPADIDYPLALPLSDDIQGITSVNAYLESLLAENSFLQCFELTVCEQVLRRIHPHYKELLINLFEPVATNALGCALAGCEVSVLRVDTEARVHLAQVFAGVSRSGLGQLFDGAATTVCAQAGLSKKGDKAAEEYLRKFAVVLADRVHAALPRQSLEGIFLDW